MALTSGNSGSKLIETITKFGTESTQEGAFCKLLGEDVCPKIYSITPEYYTMERLEQAPRSANLLRDIEKLLEEKVWNRPSQNYDVTGVRNYVEYHREVLNIEIPNWAIPDEFSLAHGDPTVSNCLIRGRELILCDPRPPRHYVPSCKIADMGKILQSYYDWELMAYNDQHQNYTLPYFMSDSLLARQAKFWCGCSVARIQHLDKIRNWNRPIIQNWCEEVKGYCGIYA